MHSQCFPKNDATGLFVWSAMTEVRFSEDVFLSFLLLLGVASMDLTVYLTSVSKTQLNLLSMTQPNTSRRRYTTVSKKTFPISIIPNHCLGDKITFFSFPPSFPFHLYSDITWSKDLRLCPCQETDQMKHCFSTSNYHKRIDAHVQIRANQRSSMISYPVGDQTFS